MERALRKLGYEVARQRGSHRIFIHPNRKRVTLPIHGSKTLHPKIISTIMKDNDLTIEAFKELI
jgi:predicted RNA binding protein YcfA (HicA-like mRNA interferase family)